MCNACFSVCDCGVGGKQKLFEPTESCLLQNEGGACTVSAFSVLGGHPLELRRSHLNLWTNSNFLIV